MLITAGVIVVMAGVVLGLAAAVVIGTRRNLFQWEQCSGPQCVDSYFVSPKALAFYRCFIFLYAFGIILYSMTDTTSKAAIFKFYTFWNFALLTVYFLFASINSLIALKDRPTYDNEVRGKHGQSHLYKFSRVTWSLFEVCATMVLLVDVVLWGILYPGENTAQGKATDTNFDSYNVHAANFLFMMTELFLSRHVFVAFHCIFVVGLPVFFGFFQWIYYAAGGSWVYPFMNTTVNIAGAWYIGLLLMHIVFFFIVFGVSRLRTHCSKKCGRRPDFVALGLDDEDDDDTLIQHN